MCFSNCDELEEIVLPESVKSLDSECFSGNPNLKSVILPSSLRSIGNLCFCNCPSLTNTSGDSGVPGIRFNGSIEQ
ncbi:MAG: leucine-rich repeat domain-containing protein [Mycoplasmoidaceae bacterium]|nr:leucine-rich repeat domain-containing protein [Mycoplasmoidaceae bacterium]